MNSPFCKLGLCLSGVLLGATLLNGMSMRQAHAVDGNKAGWQLYSEGDSDARRPYLTYIAKDNGPRVLTFACMRDIDTFGFYAEDLSEIAGPAARATLALSGGETKFTIPGQIETDPDTQAISFVAEIPLNGAAPGRLAATLVQLLRTQGPIRMAFGAKSRDLPPVNGLPNPASRFMRLCFGN